MHTYNTPNLLHAVPGEAPDISFLALLKLWCNKK
jgi:hypothetical protein